VPTELTVSARSRNLGYAWTNQPRSYPTRSGDTSLRVPVPERPQVTGGPRTLRDEARRAQRLNRGNYWNEAVFVGGRRVVAVDGVRYVSHDLVGAVLGALDDPYPVRVTVADLGEE
jgi:hypothetical protein